MPLSSSSTLDQVKAAYDDNSNYAADGSVGECQAFIQAGVMLLRRLPAETSKEGQTLRLQLDLIQDEIKFARAWLATAGASAGGGALYSDFSDFRQ